MVSESGAWTSGREVHGLGMGCRWGCALKVGWKGRDRMTLWG